KSWKPWQAGIAIGIIAMLAWLSSLPVGRNYPLGVTHGLNHTYYAIIDNNVKFIYEKPEQAKQIALNSSNQKSISNALSTVKDEKTESKPKKLNVWLIFLSIGLMLGAFVSGKMSGQTKLLPKEPSQTLIAIIGGLLIGIGAAISTGCIIGNILSAWAMLSVGMFIFGIATLLANWATTYFYLMGGSLFRK
nr:YeeE/YedE thiosulfate transporter family protein [Candidatus Kapabacteria bacterium]